MKSQTELSQLKKFYKILDELEMPLESRIAIISAASELSTERWVEGYNDGKNTWK
jgi:hypothetical protein